MRRWLIKFLGCYTQEEMCLAEMTTKDIISEIEFYRQELKNKDQEITRLTNLMLTRAGFIAPEAHIPTSQGPLQPINRKPSWPQRQRELEKEDARKLSDEIERRWKEKPGAVSERARGDVSLSDRDFIQGK